MKRMKQMAAGILLAGSLALAAGCTESDAPQAKVLLRPVTSMEVVQNKAHLSWKEVEGATTYVVEAYRMTEEGEELYKTENIPAEQTSCIVDLEWEENYKFKVRCEGGGRKSGYWETAMTGTLYRPLAIELKEARTIDTQVLVAWVPNEEVTITALTAIPIGKEAAGATLKVYPVSAEEYLSGSKVIDGLSPETAYRINLYSGTEQTSDTYQARIVLKTKMTEDLDLLYGAAPRVDLRKVEFDSDYFNRLDWSAVEEGTTFLLPGGRTYQINGGVIELVHSVHFVTPQTLEEYPTFSLENAFRVVEGGSVGHITFRRIRIQSQKPLSEVADNSLSGKQVVCPESNVFHIGTIAFTDCVIENFRSIVRSKKAAGSVEAVSFSGCTINAIGNQGIVSTDGKVGNYINEVSMDQCTVTNICAIADLRNNGNGKNIRLTNNTFCYAPMENSFLFRVDPSVAVLIENCVFGGSMKIEGKLPMFYELGAGGQDDYTGIYRFAPVGSYRTADHGSTKGNLGLTDSKMATDVLFADPGKGNFKLNELFGAASAVGASHWRR